MAGDDELELGGGVGRVGQLHLDRDCCISIFFPLANVDFVSLSCLWRFLEVKVDPVPGKLFVVVGGREVLVPEVLVEGEDKAEVDEGEDEADEAEVEERLDKQL